MLDIVTQVNVTRRQCEIVSVQTQSPLVQRAGDLGQLAVTRRLVAVYCVSLDTQLCS